MVKRMIKKRLKLAYKKLRRKIPSHTAASLLLLGQQMSRQVAIVPPNESFRKIGFKVFSQWDEDGIIQYLVSHLPMQNKTFIEFGVEDYEESNTRFLLLNDHWQGMVLDACEPDIRFIQTGSIYWEFDLQAKCAWITRENIDSLLRGAGFSEDVGLLSIDIDGNEYWIWEAIQSIRPRIVIVEYNSLFGLQPVSVPYKENFHKLSAHYSGLYYGCSLAALHHLARKKGYILVGTNIWGHNAFFIRSDIASDFKGLEPLEVYVPSKYRDSRDPTGNLTYLRGEDRMKLIEHLPVANVETGEEGLLKSFMDVNNRTRTQPGSTLNPEKDLAQTR
jgi:hypothetical protein